MTDLNVNYYKALSKIENFDLSNKHTGNNSVVSHSDRDKNKNTYYESSGNFYQTN